MMILMRLCLILSLSAAAPLNSNMDRQDLVNDDIESVDTVNGDDTGSDGLHSHTKRIGRLAFYGGAVRFSGSIISTGLANINIASMISNHKFQDLQNGQSPITQVCTVHTVSLESCFCPDETSGGSLCEAGEKCNEDGTCQLGSSCEDKFERCTHWIELSECDEWMEKNCQKTCNACPVIDGGWSGWSDYSACSATCGDASHKRTRTCSDPAPANGGKSCSGLSQETCDCDLPLCVPIDCSVSAWSEWTECSLSCGGGIQRRHRYALREAKHDGKKCQDIELSQKQPCLNIECPPIIDGVWSGWSDYSACSATCGAESQKRTRTCSDPAPANGGKYCYGWSQQTRDCNLPLCGKKRKRSVPEFVNVRGKIILPTGLDFTFPEDSSVYVSCDDISNLQSTNLGSAVLDVSNKSSKKEIIYELEADLANSGDISMSATVHVGWKRGQNGEEGIRKGDFFNDISHSLDVAEGTSQYQLDIAVVLLD